MGILGRYTPPTPENFDFRSTRQNYISLGALITIVISGTLATVALAVFLGLWYSRRRAVRKAHGQRGQSPSVDGDYAFDGEPHDAPGGSRKLRKVGSSSSNLNEANSVGQIRHGPLIPRSISAHFTRTPSRNWQPGPDRSNSRRNPWVDEDALHGPEMCSRPKGSKRSKIRDSWPMNTRAPTLPRLYHTVHGYPEDRQRENSLLGINHVRTTYGQLRMYSRVLPEPPRPAHLANHTRQHTRSVSSASQGYTLVDPQQHQRMIPTIVTTSPTRSLPRTPSKMGRKPSTDSTLTEILKSTEKRLQEGKNKLMTSPDRMGTAGTSRECLLDHHEDTVTEELLPLTCSPTEPKTPIPRKKAPGQPVTISHQRQMSDTSMMSESDTLLDELLFEVPEGPTGLTSPSRHHQKPGPERQPERQVALVQSTRSSVSSALSTVYSEDERSEGIRTNNNTPSGVASNNIQSIMVSPESMADPFSPMSSLPSNRPTTSLGWPTKQHKSQDLFRATLERSGRLRRMTIGQALTLPPEVKLPPSPLSPGRKSQSLFQSRPIDYTGLRRTEPIGSRAMNQPNPFGPIGSKIPIKATQTQTTLQFPSTSKLHSITLPPPSSSPIPVETEPTDAEEDNRLSTATDATITPSRISPTLHHRASISSSIYSQDTPSATAAFNTQSHRANSLLSTPPAPIQRPPSPTKSPSPIFTQADLRRMPSCLSATSTISSATVSPLRIANNTSPTPQPLALAVVDQLRRMNSCVSTASSIDSSTGIFSPGKRRSGSRNYLTLGSPPRQKAGSPLGVNKGSPVRHGARAASRKVSFKSSPIVWRMEEGDGSDDDDDDSIQGEVGGQGGDEKENKGSPASKVPRTEFMFQVVGEDGTPVRVFDGLGNSKRRRYGDGHGRAGSLESLGLYDQDGFLISTPLRMG
ncbi:hypothetical protein OQA88_6392 [Cercophora sp. LCS_1]